ncbi:oligosaccharide flippase family protein [Candidatus Dojkabacteria bacterium]|nr:oligosaccharide flippase family protein [Candidatus Dojkabacteria bacterium]
MKANSKVVVRGSIIMFIGIVARTIILFIRKIYIGRALGAEILGSFTLAHTIFQIVTLISLFGLYRTINRFSPQFRTEKNDNKLNTLIGTFLKFSVLLSIVFTIIVFGCAPFFSDLFNDQQLAQELRILILCTPLFIGIRLLVAISTSFENTKLEALIEHIMLTITTTVALVILVSLGIREHAISYSFLIGYVLNLALTVFLTRYTNLKHLKFSKLLKNFDKRYLFYSIPIFIFSVLTFLTQWFDTFILGYFNSSEDVGVYNIALTISTLPTLLSSSLSTSFFPTVSRLISSGELKETKRLYRDIIRILLFITVPLMATLVAFSNEILGVFGKEFHSSNFLMLYLIFGALFTIVTGPIDLVLTALDKQKMVTVNAIISIVVSIILSFLLIPKYGILGAAIANSAAISTQRLLGLIELKLIKNFTPYTMKTYFIIFVGSVLSLSLYLLKPYVIPEVIYSNMLLAIGFLALCTVGSYSAFLIIVVLFKLYHEKDKNLIITTIRKFIPNGLPN